LVLVNQLCLFLITWYAKAIDKLQWVQWCASGWGLEWDLWGEPGRTRLVGPGEVKAWQERQY